mmetsp:Transcript_9129/g.19809  ORF Transcript_9129/g.19809 Transcript_9129/m.19809 type:complete len:83 (-) Transcript_9129:905-1153(-)
MGKGRRGNHGSSNPLKTVKVSLRRRGVRQSRYHSDRNWGKPIRADLDSEKEERREGSSHLAALHWMEARTTEGGIRSNAHSH